MGQKLLFLLFFFILIGCTGSKPVHFKSPIDTNSKPIIYQTKTTYQLNDVGVYASNEFDGARLSGFEKLNDSTALVLIYPENSPINNSPYYAFKTWSAIAKPFYFTFNYPRGYNHRYVPKINNGGKWTILDSTNILTKDSIVTIRLNLTSKPTTVAAQEIQSSTDVKNWYSKLVQGKEDKVVVKSIGESKLGRNLPVLEIGKGSARGKDVIVLLTRQHPPEVTGYYAFQSFLEAILDNSELSNEFLNAYHIIAFPIMNPDGVDLGHWRHNAGGVDTNRDWSYYRQPEIKRSISYIEKTLKKNTSKLVLGLDFHSTWYDIFYTNRDRANTALPTFISQWFKSLEDNIPNYKVNETASNSERPVSKGWFLYGHNAVGITYEIGDRTPKDKIDLFGSVSAKQMMRIMLTK